VVDVSKQKSDIRITGVRYAADAIPSLAPGMSQFLLTSGSFSTVDLLAHLLSLTGPAYLDCASWCGSYGTMRAVYEFLSDERLLGFRMLMDGGFENVRSGFCEWVAKNVGDVIVLAPNHAKFCALYNRSWSLVIETSANLTKSQRCEQYRVTDDPDFCFWCVQYFDKLFELRDKKGGILRRADLEPFYG